MHELAEGLLQALWCRFDVWRRGYQAGEQAQPDQRENPEGNSAWTKRARLLQARLIERWAAVYA